MKCCFQHFSQASFLSIISIVMYALVYFVDFANNKTFLYNYIICSKNNYKEDTFHLYTASARFNLVARNRYEPLSCVEYGSKLLSCRLPAKVASELLQCLYPGTSCEKDQRHRNFGTSHSAKLLCAYIY